MLGFDALGRLALGQIPASLSIIMTANTGSFAVTGFAATCSLRLAGTLATYAFTGNAATFRVTLPAGTGSYLLSGNPSTGALVGISLAGSFTVTGNDSHYTWDHTNWLSRGTPSGSWAAESTTGSPWMPIPDKAVEFVRPDATQDLFHIFTAWGYGEYQLTQDIPAIWELNGAKAVEAGVSTILVPYDSPSVWEFAGKIGGGGEAQNTFDFFGMAHGNISKIDRVILADGVDQTNLPVGHSIKANSISYIQSCYILLPRDNTVICGSMQVTHTFDVTGLSVEVKLNPNSGFEWYNNYTGMLPCGAFDQITFGSLPTEPILLPAIPDTNDRGSQFAIYMGSSSQHDYAIKMTLPTGGPNTTGSWSDSGLDSAFWIDQVGGAKIYVTDISTAYADRKTAFPRSSITHYHILKPANPGTPNLAPDTIWTPDNDMSIPPPETV